MASTIVPEDIGELELVPEGWSWRPGQHDLAERIAQSKKKIVMLEAECGTGKSVIPSAVARAEGYRAIILIQTIQLQQQYLRDLRGLKMMAGRRHSVCNLTEKSAEHAPCAIGVRCALKGKWRNGVPEGEPECAYYKRKYEAYNAGISVQNYAYWMNETSGQASSFDKVDMIICDEAHELDQIMMAAGVIQFSLYDCDELEIPRPSGEMTFPQLQQWCKDNYKTVVEFKDDVERQARLAGIPLGQVDEDPDEETGSSSLSMEGYKNRAETIDAIVRAYKLCVRMIESMKQLNALNEAELADWVIKPPSAPRWILEAQPIYGKYGFRRILQAATEKVVLMSAFLGPELLMKTLGLNPDEVEIIRAPKVFNRMKSRIFFCPVVKMSYKMSDNQKKCAVKAIDLFANYFKGRKGIIHVPSVSLRNDIINYSKVRPRMLAYDGADTAAVRRIFPDKEEVLEEYKLTDMDAILVGQSVSTGLDLPYVPTWQIITKVAFPPLGEPAVEKRKQVDKNFYTYLTICQIVQATGRVKRAADHDGPTIITDSQFGWFYAANRQHFPPWFRDNFVRDGWSAFKDVKTELRREAQRFGVIIA